MDGIVNPAPPITPINPVPENKIKKTFQLFKDSWKSISKKQKYQMVGIFALVLALPTILGGVYTVKLLGLRAYTVTPPIPPTPTPTVKPTLTPTPKPGCGNICQSSTDCPTGLICYQPPMPTCAPGRACTLIMPSKICRNPSCPTRTNCLCAIPTPTPTPIASYRPIPTASPIPTSTPKPTVKPIPSSVPGATPKLTIKPTPTGRPTPIPIIRLTPTPQPICRLLIFGRWCLIWYPR